MDPECSGGEEDAEIGFRPIVQSETDSTHDSSPTPSAAMDMVHVIYMVQKLSNEMEKLIYDNRDRDRAMCDLTVLVKRSPDPPSGHIP